MKKDKIISSWLKVIAEVFNYTHSGSEKGLKVEVQALKEDLVLIATECNLSRCPLLCSDPVVLEHSIPYGESEFQVEFEISVLGEFTIKASNLLEGEKPEIEICFSSL